MGLLSQKGVKKFRIDFKMNELLPFLVEALTFLAFEMSLVDDRFSM